MGSVLFIFLVFYVMLCLLFFLSSSCVPNVVFVVVVFCLRLVYPMLSISLDCLLLIASLTLSNLNLYTLTYRVVRINFDN